METTMVVVRGETEEETRQARSEKVDELVSIGWKVRNWGSILKGQLSPFMTWASLYR